MKATSVKIQTIKDITFCCTAEKLDHLNSNLTYYPFSNHLLFNRQTLNSLHKTSEGGIWSRIFALEWICFSQANLQEDMLI